MGPTCCNLHSSALQQFLIGFVRSGGCHQIDGGGGGHGLGAMHEFYRTVLKMDDIDPSNFPRTEVDEEVRDGGP